MAAIMGESRLIQRSREAELTKSYDPDDTREWLMRVVFVFASALALFGCTASQKSSPGGETSGTGGDVDTDAGTDTDTDVDSGPDTDTDTDTDTDVEETGGLAHGFFAIHLDPGADPGDGTSPSALRPTRYLATLTEMVLAADAYEHKLTLMFTAQWAHHLASEGCLLPRHDTLPAGAYEYNGVVYRTCLELVRAFEAHGHEIALHHHPLGVTASWDGFTNDVAAMSAAERLEYLGTVDDLLGYVGEIPAGGSATIRSGTLEEYPASGHAVRFTSARGPTPYVSASERGDLASTPCSWAEDGSHVWRFRMRSLSETSLTELDSAASDLEGGGVDYTAGFVTHAIDAAGPDGVPFARLYERLDALNITLQPLGEVGNVYAYTESSAADDTEHTCADDEGLTP